jgi:hypothetical protein
VVVEKYQVYRARSQGYETKSYRAYSARDLYESLACELLDILGDRIVRFRVTAVLCFDKGEIVVAEKKAVQAERNAKRDLPPYLVEGMTENEIMSHDCGGKTLPSEVCVVDAGIVLGPGAAPQPIISSRIMQTRALRPVWYSYLARKFVSDVRFAGVRLLLDYRPDVAYELAHGVSTPRRSLSLHVGEGEIACMSWALRFAHTHCTQVRSGDSDLIALGLLHHDRFAVHPLMVVIHRPRTSREQTRSDTYLTLNTRAFVGRLEARGWTAMGFYLGLVANGTDFLLRSTYLSGVRKSAVMHAGRSFVERAVQGGIGADAHARLRSWVMSRISRPEEFDWLVRTAMTWHHTDPNATLWEGKKCPDFSKTVPTRSEEDLIELRTKRVGHPSRQAIATAMEHLLTNLRYWATLQGSLMHALSTGRALAELDLNLEAPGSSTGQLRRALDCDTWLPDATFPESPAELHLDGARHAFSLARSAYANRTESGKIATVGPASRPLNKAGNSVPPSAGDACAPAILTVASPVSTSRKTVKARTGVRGPVKRSTETRTKRNQGAYSAQWGQVGVRSRDGFERK